MRRFLAILAVIVLVASIFAACGGDDKEQPQAELPTTVAAAAGSQQSAAAEQTGGGVGIPDALMSIAQTRGLSPDDMQAALMTYMPSGHDDYVMFASGGHSGNVVVVGLPSMRSEGYRSLYQIVAGLAMVPMKARVYWMVATHLIWYYALVIAIIRHSASNGD